MPVKNVGRQPEERCIGMDGVRDWSDGYVTDIEYIGGFHPQQLPQNIALSSTLNGFEAPDLSRGFAYCDLGCGKGLTSLMLAAANPDAEFHAVDINAAHIAHAEIMARAAQLGNITFHKRGFGELNGPDAPALPMFDVVTMHGVWTWVSPNVQNEILEFLKQRVKPGGLVYVSYNVMSQWATLMPLRRILKGLAALSTGNSDVAARKAFAMIERLAEAEIIPTHLHEGLKQLTEEVAPSNLGAYLAHEFLNEHWNPTYHADVARAFGSANLVFAGSMDFFRNLSNVFLNDRQLAALSAIPAVDVRETLADCASSHWLRPDVFVRGGGRLSEARRNALLGALRLALVQPVPDSIEIPGPNKTVLRADPDRYRRVMTALESRPHSVAELLEGDDISAAELICVLLGTRLALPFHDADPRARAACARLNRLIEGEDEIPFSRFATVAVASLRGGLAIAAGEFDVYWALQRGERPNPGALATRFAARCQAIGGYPTVDGKHFPDETEAHQALTLDYTKKIKRLALLWDSAG